MKKKRLFVVVDFQNDFVTGSLGFPKAKDIEEHICKKIKEYREIGRKRARICQYHIALREHRGGNYMAAQRI